MAPRQDSRSTIPSLKIATNCLSSSSHLGLQSVLDLDSSGTTSTVDEEELERKVAWDANPKQLESCRLPHITSVVQVVVSILLVGAVLVVVLLGYSTEESETENPNPILVVTAEGYLKQILGRDLIPLETAAATSSVSPQQQAFDWMVEDPSLPSYPPQRIIQRYALATLFFATQGALWKNNEKWLSYDHNECTWYNSHDGNTEYPCNHETGQYEQLRLPHNNLNGTLPLEIYALTSLRSINMMGNDKLMGTISSKIGQLFNLQELSFVNCDMYGTLPTEIGLLSSMRILQLSASKDNARKFHGTIPIGLTRMTALEHLTLDFNRFSGTIPSTMATMEKLTTMGFQGNFFTGFIPTEFGQLSHLKDLYLFWNQMDGTIPSEFGLLQNLETLHLHFNSYSGPVPSTLGSLTNLKELVLSENDLQGGIPSELAHLTNLNMLYLSQNGDLTGTLPEEYAQLDLEAFDISGTGIHGTIPQSLLDAQYEASFHRYYYDCNQLFPCQE